MTFKSSETLLVADPRFADLCGVKSGIPRSMTLTDHYGSLAEIELVSGVPDEVRESFDRARNLMIYAFFSYDLLVVGELQAFGAVEFALKYRLKRLKGSSRGTLRNVVDQARKVGLLPEMAKGPHGLFDPVEALIHLRNALAHGTSDLHTPAMALGVLLACATLINGLYCP